MLLAEHNKMKEAREKREAEKKEKEEKRLAELRWVEQYWTSPSGPRLQCIVALAGGDKGTGA
jgi:hypothetical protein